MLVLNKCRNTEAIDTGSVEHIKHDKIEKTIVTLLQYCADKRWAGFDPYDALNSRLLARTPFMNSRVCRIAFTQILKWLPVNLRPLFMVPKEQNPKAIALFLMALLKLKKIRLLDQENLIGTMIDKLIALRSKETSYWCWGYSFPWQTRTILVPRGAPNLVCTSFVANALLDAYEEDCEPPYLSMAISAAEYILNELYWTDGDSVACFSYPLPPLRTRVHNANFLGAALLCRTYKNCGEKKFLEPALKVARYSAAKQRDDGSWDYGESTSQRWVDNFHTGYNLCALRSISKSTGTSEFESNIRRGFEFYRKYFFREDSAPKYFHDRTFPLDIHSVAQSIITLLTFKDLDESSVETALSIFDWAMMNMWDERGHFYYQVFPFLKNKISYMRWSHAWMLMALSTLLEEYNQERGVSVHVS